jgi:hypothetical protein
MPKQEPTSSNHPLDQLIEHLRTTPRDLIQVTWKQDGKGGAHYAVEMPSKAEIQKQKAMQQYTQQEQAAPGVVQMPGEPIAAASKPQVLVKVAMGDNKGWLKGKYPEKWLKSMGLA